MTPREKADRVFGPGPIPLCWFNFPSPEIAELAAECGFRAGVIDLEHTSISLETAQRMMMGMKGTNMRAMVRLPEANTGLTKRVLDIGATGILLPYVTSIDEVKRTVADMTYGPRGQRGNASYVNRVSGYGGNAAEAVRRSDEENILIVMIESRAGLALAPELANIDGVDALFFGPGDYSFDIGRVEKDSKEILDAYHEIEKAARSAGKMFGSAAFSNMTAARFVEMGCDFFGGSSDVTALRAGFTGALASVRAAVSKSA